MYNLIECLKINMQIKAPAVRTTPARIKEVLEECNISDASSFGKFYDYQDPIKHFIDDYVVYASSVGFKKR